MAILKGQLPHCYAKELRAETKGGAKRQLLGTAASLGQPVVMEEGLRGWNPVSSVRKRAKADHKSLRDL